MAKMFTAPEGLLVEPKPLPTVADLRAIGQRNPLVAHLLRSWEAGHFATFEQCLVVLAVELARANAVLARQAIRAMAHATPTPVVIPPAAPREGVRAAFDRWRPHYVHEGFPLAAGWYANRTPRPGPKGTGIVAEINGPFAGGEPECIQWCQQKNAEGETAGGKS